MKRGLLVFGFLFVVLLSGFVLAADVAYIAQNENKVDTMTWMALEDMGLEVDLVTDDMIMDTDFSEYDFVLIGDGRLWNADSIPMMPTVLMNKRYAEHFDFLDRGRTRMMGANRNLEVMVQGEVMDVYDMASMKLGGPALTFNYLPMKFMNSDLVNYAAIDTIDKSKMGSVVAFNEDMDTCWFGINPKMMNANSWMLFSDCVMTAMDMDVIQTHDVGFDMDYSNSLDGLRIKDVASGDFLLDTVTELECGMDYKVDFKTENLGDFTEDVMFDGVLGEFTWDAEKTDLAAGGTTTTGSKTITIGSDVADNGFYDLEVTATIAFDEDESNNMMSRRVEVVGC